MSKSWLYFVGTCAAALLLIAGCPTDSGGTTGGGTSGGGTGATSATGRWSGSVQSTTTQTVLGITTQPQYATKTLSIEFGTDGFPVSVVVIGYAAGDDLSAALQKKDDTATLTSNSDNANATYVVTVRSATYSSTHVKLTLDINYMATSGNSTRNGTGVQTIEAFVNGSQLTYTASVSYDVTLHAGSAEIATTDREDWSGTLAKQ